MADKQVELTKGQKEQVIKYHLSGVSKGLFEDCEKFWEGLSQEEIDALYPSYSRSSEIFMDKVRLVVLSMIAAGEL